MIPRAQSEPERKHRIVFNPFKELYTGRYQTESFGYWLGGCFCVFFGSEDSSYSYNDNHILDITALGLLDYLLIVPALIKLAEYRARAQGHGGAQKAWCFFKVCWYVITWPIAAILTGVLLPVIYVSYLYFSAVTQRLQEKQERKQFERTRENLFNELEVLSFQPSQRPRFKGLKECPAFNVTENILSGTIEAQNLKGLEASFGGRENMWQQCFLHRPSWVEDKEPPYGHAFGLFTGEKENTAVVLIAIIVPCEKNALAFYFMKELNAFAYHLLGKDDREVIRQFCLRPSPYDATTTAQLVYGALRNEGGESGMPPSSNKDAFAFLAQEIVEYAQETGGPDNKEEGISWKDAQSSNYIGIFRLPWFPYYHTDHHYYGIEKRFDNNGIINVRSAAQERAVMDDSCEFFHARCEISRRIAFEPVTALPCGHTFERALIERNLEEKEEENKLMFCPYHDYEDKVFIYIWPSKRPEKKAPMPIHTFFSNKLLKQEIVQFLTATKIQLEHDAKHGFPAQVKKSSFKPGATALLVDRFLKHSVNKVVLEKEYKDFLEKRRKGTGFF